MRRRNSNGLRRLGRGHIPAVRSLDRQRRQDPVEIGPGVDADAIDLLVDGAADGMAMNDDKAVIGLVVEERTANPAQVRLPLLVEQYAGTDAGMDEQIVAEAAGIDEAPQERDMVLGDRLAHERQSGLLVDAGEPVGIKPVTAQAFR